MLSFFRILSIASAMLILGCGKGDGGGSPTEPLPKPTLLNPTIEVSTQMVRPDPLTVMLRASGNVRYSNGEVVLDGYSWSVNDTVRGTGTTLQFMVSKPGTYNVCLLVKNLSVCSSVSVVAPQIIFSANLSVTVEKGKETFPNSKVKLICTGVDSYYNTVTDGFIIRINDEVVSTSSNFETVLSPGTYISSCTVRNSDEDVKDFTVESPKPIMVQVSVIGPLGEQDIPMKVCAERGNISNCTQTNPNILSPLITPLIFEDSIILTATCRDAPCGVIPSVTPLLKSNFFTPQIFTTLVKNWEIKSGAYSGKSNLLSMAKAYAPALGINYSFLWRDAPTMYLPKWYYPTSTWKNFPVAVAFDPENSDFPPTTEELSKALLYIDSLNLELGDVPHLPGVKWFKLGTIGVDVQRVMNGSDIEYVGGIGVSLRANNPGNAQVYGNGIDITGVKVRINNYFLLANAFTFNHELIHGLNIGHGSKDSWYPGLMTDHQNANPVSNPLYGRLIIEEVSHIQAFYRVALSQRVNGGYGIAQIHQGERFFSNFAIEPVLNNQSTVTGSVMFQKNR